MNGPKDNDFIYHERVPDEKNLAPITKGQLISKCPFGVFKWTIFVRISTLASKKRLNQKR